LRKTNWNIIELNEVYDINVKRLLVNSEYLEIYFKKGKRKDSFFEKSTPNFLYLNIL
jgi:hypothetical protein